MSYITRGGSGGCSGTCSSLLACPTCGAGCNCDCQNGHCVEVPRSVINPSNTKGYGFTNTFDGRVRGGIKTPEAFIGNAQPTGREFSIFEEKPKNSNIMNYQNRGNSNRAVRMHPLGRTRRIGATVYDPIGRMWKVDDGRPRDAVLSGGKIVWPCWGSCSTGSRWRGNKVKCKCNRAGSGNCHCDGCAGNTGC